MASVICLKFFIDLLKKLERSFSHSLALLKSSSWLLRILIVLFLVKRVVKPWMASFSNFRYFGKSMTNRIINYLKYEEALSVVCLRFKPLAAGFEAWKVQGIH